jgi:uncharacterized integral membrane protein
VKLHYQIGIEDLVAFGRHFHERSPTFHRQTRIVGAIVALIVFVAVLLFFVSVLRVPVDAPRPEWVSTLLLILGFSLAALFGSLVYFFWKPIALNTVTNRLRKFYARHAENADLAKHELEIVESQLIQRSKQGEFRWNLEAFCEIESTVQHIFLWLDGANALVVPRVGVDATELDAFLDQLDRARHKLVADPPSSHAPSEAIQRDKSSLQL